MSIVASIRRAILIDEARGYIVPDETSKLDPTPQIIIESDDEDVFLNFVDGLGWDKGINVYQGYGSTFIWTNNGPPPKSLIGQMIDNADPDEVPIFNEESGLYEPGKAALVDYTAGDPEDGQVLAWSDTAEKYVPVDPSGGGGGGDETDYILLSIERPTDRNYSIALSTPTDMTILSHTSDIEAGTATVTLTTGFYAAGSNIDVTVSGTNSASRMLVIQIDYEKPLS